MTEFNLEIIIKILTLSLATLGVWKGIIEYKKSQKWKQAEFLADEYKRFINDPYVKKTFLMLDGYSICIPVNKNEVDGKMENIEFTPEKLLASLKEIENESTRPKDEVYIRICIDRYLFKLGIFQSYINSDLVSKEQVNNYLSYWLNLIGDTSNTTLKKEIKLELHKFIKKYNYQGIISLLKTYNYSLGEKFE